MISKRMKTLVENGAAVRALFEEGRRLAEIHGAENVYDFSLGNPSFPPPEAVKNATVDVITTGDPMYIHRYTPNAGFPEVRKAVSDSLNARFGMHYTENSIVMTVGAASGLNTVFCTLLNPGDEVLTTSPYFFEYGNYVENHGGKLIVVPTSAEDGFMLDIDAMEAALTPRTMVVLINSPNNPSGVVYPAALIEKLAAMLERKQKDFGHPIYLVADEPYRELVYDGIEVPYIPHFYRNSLVCYSWSKSLSLPGERVGYIAVTPEADDSELVFDALLTACRIYFVNAPSLQQLIIARCLDASTDISAYDSNRKALYDCLKGCGFECTYPSGAFYLWLKCPMDEAEFFAKAKSHNLLFTRGSAFGTPGYVRLAYCVQPDMIKRAEPALRQLAADCGLL